MAYKTPELQKVDIDLSKGITIMYKVINNVTIYTQAHNKDLEKFYKSLGNLDRDYKFNFHPAVSLGLKVKVMKKFGEELMERFVKLAKKYIKWAKASKIRPHTYAELHLFISELTEEK